jgi:hypothetical protein
MTTPLPEIMMIPVPVLLYVLVPVSDCCMMCEIIATDVQHNHLEWDLVLNVDRVSLSEYCTQMSMCTRLSQENIEPAGSLQSK